MNKNNNKFESNKKYFTISVYAFFVIIFSMLFYLFIGNWTATRGVFRSIINVLSPFLIAFLIAYLLLPLITWVEKNFVSNLGIKKYRINNLKLKRILSILIVYIIVIGFLGLTLVYVIPQIAKSIDDMIDNVNNLPRIFNDTSLLFESTIEHIFEHYPTVDVEIIKNTINSYLPNIVEESRKALTKFLPFLYGFSISIVTGLINLILAFVIAFYLMNEKELFLVKSKKIIYAFFPEEKASNLIIIFKESHRIFSNFVIGKALDSLIIGILCFIILIIFRIEYSLLLSIIIGITNMIPYFGPFIGAIPGILILILINPMQAFWFAIIIFALQQFDGLYLGPKILGDSTGLTPFWVIFSIIIGGALFGVVGMFLGVPIFAVLNYLFNKLINKKLENKSPDIL
ncbi:putative PurR-regulated permease PerM [Natranaerovirga pectinivora]|uniref:Putative PurR-regulated permease PerM n=1 Tax=Natranaerovirga pectinivora TaxID=682400 RepID=A0A4R3MEP5_9FIRM|nr:AI-2E family transporter [Natranaerovirga pectinivora]TCT12271.1 putative PurR-regulated permease PerM [Natranaerovirga pectinivora]